MKKKTEKAAGDRKRRVTARKVGRVFLDYFLISVGAAVYALSVVLFTAPNNIAPGGIAGVSTLLNYLYGFPIGVVTLILNIPLLIWGAVENGLRFIIRTVIGTAISSVLIDVFSLIPFHYSGEMILAAIFGGLISGTGLGLIFLRGGSTGGTDIIGRNLHKHFQYLSVGTIILICDVVVIVASAVVYKSIENALYAVIAIFTSTKLIDAVVFGFSHDNGKLLIVITAKPDKVSAVLLEAGRGVTLLPAKGAYTDTPRGAILCATHSREVYRIKNLITEADPDAFIITSTATAISGQGFENAI